MPNGTTPARFDRRSIKRRRTSGPRPSALCKAFDPFSHRLALRPPRLRVGGARRCLERRYRPRHRRGIELRQRALQRGASRGDSGNLSSAIVRRTAAVTAACSSSEKSMFGIVGYSQPPRCGTGQMPSAAPSGRPGTSMPRVRMLGKPQIALGLHREIEPRIAADELAELRRHRRRHGD